MANKQADDLTVIGIGFCVLTAPITGGLSLFGIPGFLGARALRSNLDAKKESKKKEDSSVRSLVPYRTNPMIPQITDYCSYSSPEISNFISAYPRIDLISDAILAKEKPSQLIDLRKRIADEDFLLGVTQSMAPAVEEMVLRHPSPKRLRVRGNVRRTIWGGTKFNFDVDID